MNYFVLLNLGLLLFFSVQNNCAMIHSQLFCMDKNIENNNEQNKKESVVLLICSRLGQLVQAINHKEIEKAVSIVSPSNYRLRGGIADIIAKRNIVYECFISYVLKEDNVYTIADGAFQYIDDATVKIIGLCNLEEKIGFINFTKNSFSNYFIFQKNGDEWYLIDTDFCESLDMKMIYLCIFVAMLIFMFWIWMIIDCVQRNFNRRGRWLALILFLNILGALIYFFCIKLKQWKNEPKISE